MSVSTSALNRRVNNVPPMSIPLDPCARGDSTIMECRMVSHSKLKHHNLLITPHVNVLVAVSVSQEPAFSRNDRCGQVYVLFLLPSGVDNMDQTIHLYRCAEAPTLKGHRKKNPLP